MNEVERAQKALEIIAKEGDLYDVIAKAKNVKPSKNGFGRFHVLLLSRILFTGVLLKDKIASIFSPVEKVHDAQEEIRSILGFNVDIINDKVVGEMYKAVFPKRRGLSIMYEDAAAYMDEYINNVQKILSFCSLHNINIIYLSEDDVENLFPGINLSSFEGICRKTILNSTTYPSEQDNFLNLNLDKLKELISKMTNFRLDKKFIMDIGRRIADPTIRAALNEYQYTGDITRLKNIIVSRLCLNINSDSSYKTREYGKTYDMVSISGEFIKVISNSRNASKPETHIMLLCEYLGYPNYDALLKSLNNPQDDEEKILIAVLYLYINKQNKINCPTSERRQSFYDTVYESFISNKEQNKNRRVRNLYTKEDKISTHFTAYMLSIYYTAVLFALVIVTGMGIDAIHYYFFGGERTDVPTKVFEFIIKPYRFSYELEKSLITGALDEVEEMRVELGDSLSTFIGDSFGFNLNENKVVGTVTSLNGEDLPRYYAAEYGASSEYKSGNITYDLKEILVDYNEMYTPLNEALAIEVNFTKKDIKEMLDNNYINIPLALYPVDGNYYLSTIVIYDDKDKEKEFVLNDWRAYINGGEISEEEKDLLLSMKKPIIKYTYGLAREYFNTFSMNIQKDGSYLETEPSEMKKIIIESLGLPASASYEEIYAAIKNKDYSLTPIKDAGLTRKIKKLDEKEFISTLASLDSLICNFAATLAVEANDELAYVVGFYTSEDTITYADAHAWAMDQNGNIIDVTPSNIEEKEEESSIIENVFRWAAQAKIPFLIGISLATYLVYQILGKRIYFTIRQAQIKSLLSSPDMSDAYCLINSEMYGGVNIPHKRTPEENLKMIIKDFEGYTKEELESILKGLKESQDKARPTALKVVKSVPYIKKNQVALTRRLNKRKW